MVQRSLSSGKLETVITLLFKCPLAMVIRCWIRDSLGFGGGRPFLLIEKTESKFMPHLDTKVIGGR